ncbi:class I SAM-dependent methyltransferase [Acidobacteriota bacterium]
MYLTDVFKNEGNETFDWENYFSPDSHWDITHHVDPIQLIAKLRKHLKENSFQLTFTLTRLMRELLKGIDIKNPKILELGAATGFLSRWFLSQYGGSTLLVDKSKASFKAYSDMKDDIKRFITYLNTDLFELELEERFDLVCSFGLIEHFIDKRPVLAAHKKFVTADGMIVILVPLDSPLSRAFLEVHPELNLGYRELLTEKEFKKILVESGLDLVKTKVSQGFFFKYPAKFSVILSNAEVVLADNTIN